MFQALGAKQVFLTTRCNFPSLWNLPRGGVWPAELEKGKQILLSMPRNNLGQEEQTRDRILQTCYPNFSPGQPCASSPGNEGREDTRSKQHHLFISQQNPDCTSFSLLPGKQQIPVSAGEKSQQRVDIHSWISRLCSPWDRTVWAATSQPRPAWPV